MTLIIGQRYQALELATIYEVLPTTSLTLTTTETSMVGAQIDIYPWKNSQRFRITATIDFRTTTVGTGYCHGIMSIDNTTVRDALHVAQSVETRESSILQYVHTAGTAGMGHFTVRIRGKKDVAGGVASIEAGICTSLIVEPIP